MSILEEYWTGVLQRLQAEVDVFASLVEHNGEKGRENEAALGRLLENFVPKRLGVGTGMVIDSHDSYAQQGDILLFDHANEPTIFAQTTQLLFPVESVHASIEVKTTLRHDDIVDCQKKAQSLQTLVPGRNHPDGTSHPLFVVLAYQSDTLSETVHANFVKGERQPDLYCVLQSGLIGGTNVLDDSGEFKAGLTLLRQPDAEGRRTGQPEELIGKLTETTVMRGDRVYPIASLGGRNHVAEPARALLLFVEALARLLAFKQCEPAPVSTIYLKDPGSQVVFLDS